MVLCGGQEDQTYTDRRIRDFLRYLLRRDAMIGSVSTGSFILAEAGLLDGRRCTTHWDYVESLRERYPQLDVCTDIFVFDRRVFTCGGGVAAMDVMLELIRDLRGYDFANCVSENFVYGSIRSHDESQRMSLRSRLGVPHTTLIDAVALMKSQTGNAIATAGACTAHRRVATTAGAAVRDAAGCFAGAVLCPAAAGQGTGAGQAFAHVDLRGGRRLRLRFGLALFTQLPPPFRLRPHRRPRASALMDGGQDKGDWCLSVHRMQ